jgi:hypothetical protein
MVEEYEKSVDAIRSREHLAALRAATSFLNPRAYRGISRQPLEPYETTDLARLRHMEPPETLRRNAKARLRFREILGEQGFDPEESEDCLSSLEDAAEVHALLETAGEYEVVLLERAFPHVSPGVLGYDVGYWSGDHFSLICDTLVAPLWHPPQPEDFGELAMRARALNDHALFPSAVLASRFREWYVRKPWAETEHEPGEFCVIRVSATAVMG